MGESGRPKGLLAERQIWQLEAELQRLQGLQGLQGLFGWHRQDVDKDLAALERRIGENEDEIEGVKKSISSAICWLAIGVAGIVFELLRKGATF
jgi:hypothetical protein